jgi:hypothetical protein
VRLAATPSNLRARLVRCAIDPLPDALPFTVGQGQPLENNPPAPGPSAGRFGSTPLSSRISIEAIPTSPPMPSERGVLSRVGRPLLYHSGSALHRWLDRLSLLGGNGAVQPFLVIRLFGGALCHHVSEDNKLGDAPRYQCRRHVVLRTRRPRTPRHTSPTLGPSGFDFPREPPGHCACRCQARQRADCGAPSDLSVRRASDAEAASR